MTDLDILKIRLQNTETALFGVTVLVGDTLSPAYQDDLAGIMQKYFQSNTALGFKPGTCFYDKNWKEVKEG